MTPVTDPRPRHRTPKQLLLAYFGEFAGEADAPPVRTRLPLHALSGAGVSAAATRAALDRMVQSGLLVRHRRGREAAYSMTPSARQMVARADARVHSPHPFEPSGPGWSLVIFSLPDEAQPVRHRLRSILTWEGFAPFGRGTWIAPGAVDFDALRSALRHHLDGDAVLALRAEAVEGFPIAEVARGVWDLGAIETSHRSFLHAWGGVAWTERSASPGQPSPSANSPLAERVMLLADWLELLRKDPRLPRRLLPAACPSEASHAAFAAQWNRLEHPSLRELRTLESE